ncbi:MAG: META domain-containing protein [Candidatus Electrothrix scaldis]|nr:MAG: META domain-containing protein [Candidatus Electrothrix sp. GW3-3]
MRIHFRLFFLLVLLLAGCVPRQKHVASPGALTFPHPLPAVFQAHLDLKRCPSTSFELVLRPDGMYYLQMEKEIPGRAALQAEVGVWRYTAENQTLLLRSYNRASRFFRFTGKKVLKLLKVSGGMMPQLVRYDFTLAKTAPRYEGLVRMQGMYSRQRGRGFFRECLSGARFPLASGDQTAGIEQSYQEILHGRDESLLVTLDMRLAKGSGRRNLLMPLRSVSLDPYHSCRGKDRRIATIANNRWYLTELAGKTVTPESVTNPPFLKVQSGEQLIQGFAGCNNFTGSWLFADNDFVFSRIRSTRMACPLGMEVEDAFLQALDATRRYAIKGDILSLHDRRGRVLARLRYSRPLTDLDFSYLAADQEEVDEDALPADALASPESRVETGGAVPASVVRTPVREVNEKILPLPEPEQASHKKAFHEIKVVKPKKKVAKKKKVRAVAQPAQAKEVVPAPKPSAPSVDQTKQEQEKQQQHEPQQEQQNKQQNEKVVVPPPAPVDQEKSVVGKKEAKASVGNGINVDPTSLPQTPSQEEREFARELPLPIPEKNAPPIESEGRVVNNEVEIPVEQPAGQEQIQTGTEGEPTSPPALPPIPEEDEGEQKIQAEPVIMEENGEQVPAAETSQQDLQEENKAEPDDLPFPEVMNQELQGKAEETVMALPEENAMEVSPSSEERKPAESTTGPKQPEVQAQVEGNTVKQIAPVTIPTP